MALLISGMAGCGVQAGETSSDDAVELSPGAAIGSELGSGGLRPLSSEPVPQPTGGHIVNQAAAVRLGKALFWDIQTGGDGRTACASCRHLAGADDQRFNTLSPGPDGVFASGGVTGPGQAARSPAASTIPTVRAARQLDTVAPQPAPNSPLAPGLAVLHTLTPADGIAVRGALTELDGRLYGLAGERGPNGTPQCSSSALWQTTDHTQRCPGSLFSLKLDGSDFRVDHAFTQLDGAGRNADGYHAYGTLAVGPDRRLYGVTQMGGSPPDPTIPGFGVLFAYSTDGAFEVLHTFFSEPRAADGEYPMGAVAVTPDGSVCGTAKGGGHAGTGTVWCWRTSGQFDHADLPGETYGGVALAGGLLHGTTWGPGMGVYFTADPETMAVRIVDSFPSFVWPEHGNDNTPIQAPLGLTGGGVIVAREFGGAAGTGSIVRLTPTRIRPLRDAANIPLEATPRFSNATGGMPNGQLAEGPDGAIYGTMQYGGAAGTGVVYRLSRGSARIELLWSWSDSAYPYGGVTLGSDCALYGVTFGTGQVWRMTLSGCG